MTDQSAELLAAVDSLLAAVDDGTVLPVPAERVRLREAAGLTEAAVAQALGVRVPSIQAWEAGRAEPKGSAWMPTAGCSRASLTAIPRHCPRVLLPRWRSRSCHKQARHPRLRP